MTRTLACGREWCVSEYICSAGPADRPFEEHHDQVTVAAVIAGSFSYHNDSGRALLHPGALLFGNPGTCYQCGHAHSAGDRCISLQLAPEYFAEIAASAAGSSRFRFSMPMLTGIPKVLPWLTRIEAWAAITDRLAIDAVIPRLIEAIISVAAGEVPCLVQVSARDERRVIGVLRHIELHSADDISLDTMAEQAGMSRYHFLRVFRRTVGTTPHQFLLGVRMRRAAVRLAVSPEPVSAIAFDAGFGDLSTFNGRFRDIYGMSPTVYRSRGRA